MIGNANVSLIVIMAENRVMARRGGIPWHIKCDQERYRRHIKSHIVIMGRKTMDETYTETENIVITSQEDYKPPIPAHVVHSVDDAFQKAKELLKTKNPAFVTDEVFVLGGGEIFKQTIDRADKLYLTIVHEHTIGDTYFPDYSQFTKIVYDKKEESDGYVYEFIDLER